MRIEGPNRNTGLGRAGALSGRASGAVFSPQGTPGALPSASAAPLAATGGIAALLALQVVDDPLMARRKAIRRGTRLLDTLDALKADLLSGRLDDERLDGLMTVLSEARERTAPGLEGLLDAIELRARVELAKRGRYGDA